MRVGLISFNARAGDAIGNHVAEKLKFFQERGAEIRVFLEDHNSVHPEIKDFCIPLSPSELRSNPVSFLFSCDLILAEYGQDYSLLHWLPVLAGKKPRIVIDYHGVTPPKLWGPHNREGLLGGMKNKGLLWCADVVLVHSRYTYDELHNKQQFPRERLYQLGFVVEMPKKPLEKRDNRLRQSLGEEATVLLYVGRLAANKRLPLLVEGLQHLRHMQPPINLLIVGNDKDIYQVEADRCREKSRELGLMDRIHFLGHRVGAELIEAYHSADLFVTASAWESFCIPVVEAMACGLPVVAARATALPDTLGSAGLTFTGEDAFDLAKTLRRVLPTSKRNTFPCKETTKKRIAVVNLRSVIGGISGVEKSLQTIARTLRNNGHDVHWLSSNTENGQSSPGSKEVEFLSSLPHASTFLQELKERANDFDVIIVGPYLSRLTFEIALLFPEKTMLLPCFHDEPAARLALWHKAYQNVSGFLYHSEEERTFAQAELGFNHPNSVVIGTLLEPGTEGLIEKSPLSGRYVIYCGRFTAEKNVPLLLEFSTRYQKEFPNRFQFLFLGTGNIPIPQEPWAKNLGIVSEGEKKQWLAHADALVNLSCHESLSLVALEAWQLGTPVIANTHCAVLASHISQCDGGSTIKDYLTFADSMNDLWEHSAQWQEKGKRGQAFVQRHYDAESSFASRLNEALTAMFLPLAEQLQGRGFERANQFTRAAWQLHFSQAVEQALHREQDDQPLCLEVRRRVASRTVTSGRHSLLVPVQVHNWGTYPAACEGPGQTLICARLMDESTQKWVGEVFFSPLPKIVTPGSKIPASVSVPIPVKPGRYSVVLWAQSRPEIDSSNIQIPSLDSRLSSNMRIVVEESASREDLPCSLLLDNVQQELNEANRLQKLPEDYLDITQGALAKIKRKLKQKLLHNFKFAYVDVLSRQQSAFNRQILNIVQELAECCALLDHAVQQLQQGTSTLPRKKKRSRQRTPVPSSDIPSP